MIIGYDIVRDNSQKYIQWKKRKEINKENSLVADD